MAVSAPLHIQEGPGSTTLAYIPGNKHSLQACTEISAVQLADSFIPMPSRGPGAAAQQSAELQDSPPAHASGS